MDKEGTSNEVVLNQMKAVLSDLLDSKLASLATKQDIHALREAYNSMKEENKLLRCEIQQLKEANVKSEKLMEDLDNKSRRNNLIFRGVLKHSSSGGTKTYSDIISEFCKDILKVEIMADNIHAFPLGSRDTSNSPLMVSFTHFRDKILVLGAIRTLKNTGFIIHQDVAEVTRKKRTKLILIRKELVRLNSRLRHH
uniref:Uncharacterized protein n=1 Tax=Rhodnius prolixus TaxID=13249 RepID=T1HX64_RHOPR